MKVDKSKWEKKLIRDVCLKIIAGGDKPLGYTFEKTNINQIPIYANGIKDDGLYGFCSEAKVNVPSITISGRGTIGFSVVHYKPFTPIVRLLVAIPKKDMSLTFLKYEFNNIKFKSTGNTIPQLPVPIFEKHSIIVPPLSEQQAIASELDAIKSLITKYNEQLNDYDNLAKSIFNEMFGDVVSNDKGWERKKLSEMCSEVTSSKRIFAKEYVKTGIPFYRSKEVIERSKGLEPSTELFISTERYNEIKNQYGIPRKNDLLISAVGTIGDIWVVNIEKPFYFKDGNLIWIKTNSLTNSIYLKYLLRILIAEYKKSMPNGAAYSALTINKLQNLVVYNIPLSLQQTFAARIEAIEKQKEQIKQQITDLQTLFDSRMQYYFD